MDGQETKWLRIFLEYNKRMRQKKFRHIHRYAFVDIGNRPWIHKSIYNLLTEPAKEHVKEKNGYVVGKRSEGNSSQYILKMHDFASSIKSDFLTLNSGIEIEEYLMTNLKYSIRKPFSKYIDEYNWYKAFGVNR